MKKKIINSALAGTFLLSISRLVSAHCPLCTAGAAAGVATARYFGVHDSIVGLFLGAFIVSTALWFNKWLLKKGKRFVLQESILVVLSFLLLAVPLYTGGVIVDFEMVKSMPEHHSVLGMGLYGIDALLFGMIAGSVAIWGVFGFSEHIKRKRGRVLWPYQGVSFMFITLAVLSFILWLITK